jgi:hypothetical protein
MRFNLNDQPICNNVELNIYFGEIEADECDVTYNSVTMPLHNLDGDETDEFGEVLNSQDQASVVLIYDSCGVRTDQPFDFSLPSSRNYRSKLIQLSEGHQRNFSQLIDEFREYLNETPYVEHSITIDADFKPRRLWTIVFLRFLNRKSDVRSRNF